MITYTKLSELPIEDVVSLWNQGFEGYFVNIHMSVDSFLTRVVNEGLSLEDSLAAHVDGQPVGIVVNGFREIEGKKVAWNGGTGIAPAYRGQGIGRKLMERNLELYDEQGVDLASLEALSQNEQAIKLYTRVGYTIIDRLAILQHLEPLAPDILQASTQHRYSTRKGQPGEVRSLPFYRHFSAWQTQWPSIKDGNSLIVFHGNDAVGYALYKRILDSDGSLSAISLYQCEAHPNRLDAEEILKAALLEIFHPVDVPCRRMTSNLRTSNMQLIHLLHRVGFTTLMEQVHMVNNRS
jgi:ribosomal protein S18 acetylase RimI-like enzyme